MCFTGQDMVDEVKSRDEQHDSSESSSILTVTSPKPLSSPTEARKSLSRDWKLLPNLKSPTMSSRINSKDRAIAGVSIDGEVHQDAVCRSLDSLASTVLSVTLLVAVHW